MHCETLCQKKARRLRRVQQFMLMARGLSPNLPNKQVPVLAPSPRAIQCMARASLAKLWLGKSRGVGQEWNLMLGKEWTQIRLRINYSDSGIPCYKKRHWKAELSEAFEFIRSCLTSVSRLERLERSFSVMVFQNLIIRAIYWRLRILQFTEVDRYWDFHVSLCLLHRFLFSVFLFPKKRITRLKQKSQNIYFVVN